MQRKELLCRSEFLRKAIRRSVFDEPFFYLDEERAARVYAALRSRDALAIAASLYGKAGKEEEARQVEAGVEGLVPFLRREGACGEGD